MTPSASAGMDVPSEYAGAPGNYNQPPARSATDPMGQAAGQVPAGYGAPGYGQPSMTGGAPDRMASLAGQGYRTVCELPA